MRHKLITSDRARKRKESATEREKEKNGAEANRSSYHWQTSFVTRPVCVDVTDNGDRLVVSGDLSFSLCDPIGFLFPLLVRSARASYKVQACQIATGFSLCKRWTETGSQANKNGKGSS